MRKGSRIHKVEAIGPAWRRNKSKKILNFLESLDDCAKLPGFLIFNFYPKLPPMFKSLNMASLKDHFFADGKLKMDYYFLGATAAIIGIALFKLPQLGLPYFWDEAWSYGPAVGMMYENGPSLLPDAIPAINSRGHPLLFHFLAAGWMRIFGDSLVSAHSFALLISVFTLFALYQFGKKFFSPKIGLMAVIFFGLQRVFLAQSAMVLPEMMMALWTLLAILNWFQNRRILFAIFASLLMLTKESGGVVIAAIGIWTLIEQFVVKKGKVLEKDFLWRIAALAVPVLVMATFYIVQKIMMGWFLFPNHVSLIDPNWLVVRDKLLLCYGFIFKSQGRWLLSTVFLVSVLLVSKRFTWNERLWLTVGAVLIPAFLIAFPQSDLILIPILLTILMALLIGKLWTKVPVERSESHRMTWFVLLFAILYVVFTAYNFMSFRYLLMIMAPIFPVMLHWIGRAFDGKVKRWIFYGIMALMAVWVYRQTSLQSPLADISMSYADALKVQLEVVDYLEENWDRDTQIYTNHQYDTVLREPYAGFLDKDSVYTRITDVFDQDVQLVLISNNHKDTVTTHPAYLEKLEFVQTYKRNWYKTDVYKMKPDAWP